MGSSLREIYDEGVLSNVSVGLVIFCMVYLVLGKLAGSGFTFHSSVFYFLPVVLVLMDLPYEQSLAKRSGLFEPLEALFSTGMFKDVPPFNITNATADIKNWNVIKLVNKHVFKSE